jgi:RimJ/RimL family protein N-acetyltransferase
MNNLFEGSLVRLRALQPGDEEIVFSQMLDSEISRRDSSVEWPKSLAEIKESLEKHDRQAKNDDKGLMIETLDGRIVGGVNTQLSDPRNGVFSVGISLGDRTEWGKGYAKQAMLIVLRHMFHERRYQKCNIGVYDFNSRAIGLYRHLGFSDEGRLRRVYFTNGEYHDEVLLGLTSEEFDERYPEWCVEIHED